MFLNKLIIVFFDRWKRNWSLSVGIFWMHWIGTYSPLQPWESQGSSTIKCRCFLLRLLINRLINPPRCSWKKARYSCFRGNAPKSTSSAMFWMIENHVPAVCDCRCTECSGIDSNHQVFSLVTYNHWWADWALMDDSSWSNAWSLCNTGWSSHHYPVTVKVTVE